MPVYTMWADKISLTQCTSTSLIHPINWLNHYAITKHKKLAYMPHYYTAHGIILHMVLDLYWYDQSIVKHEGLQLNIT